MQQQCYFTLIISMDLQHNWLFLQPVRFFFLILSFFLLYLSCLPCTDSKECNAKAEVKASASTNHQEHNHQSEACSPFCTCSCCAAPVFFSPFTKVQDPNSALQTAKYSLYDVSFNSEVFSSIWQPPQLS